MYRLYVKNMLIVNNFLRVPMTKANQFQIKITLKVVLYHFTYQMGIVT